MMPIDKDAYDRTELIRDGKPKEVSLEATYARSTCSAVPVAPVALLTPLIDPSATLATTHSVALSSPSAGVPFVHADTVSTPSNPDVPSISSSPASLSLLPSDTSTPPTIPCASESSAKLSAATATSLDKINSAAEVIRTDPAPSLSSIRLTSRGSLVIEKSMIEPIMIFSNLCLETEIPQGQVSISCWKL